MNFGWWNDVETDYGLARETFMTKEILGLDTFQILLGGRFCLIEILQ